MIDYIIVGGGLAGVCFAELALQQHKQIKMIEGDLSSSSRVAGGMYNPVVLKRFTEVWKTQEQLDFADDLYASIANRIGLRFKHPMPVYRRFASVEEQNDWFVALDKKTVSAFLNPDLMGNTIEGVDAPLGYGLVNRTGFLEVSKLLKGYRDFLDAQGLFMNSVFDYDALKLVEGGVEYKGIFAKNIIFAEGFGMHHNPYFSMLPLDGTKGELLLVRIPDLKLDGILKGKVFVIPVGDGLFRVGATYNWKDKTITPTADGLEELLSGLRELITVDFEVVSHEAGVRPTVKDRKPLVGRSDVSNSVHILNGLGTRGVLLGPYLANALIKNIEEHIPLDAYISIARFNKK